MLHDIGIFRCKLPISLSWRCEYICHGYLGAELMRAEGYPRHARVCERHTGTGITLAMVEERGLPLPHRDFMPETLEEQLILLRRQVLQQNETGQRKICRKGKTGPFEVWKRNCRTV